MGIFDQPFAIGEVRPEGDNGYPIAVQNGLRLEMACQTGLSLTRQRDRFL